MFYNYVYRQQPSYLMAFKCNFDFMLVYIVNLWHSTRVSGFSPHVIFVVKT